MYGYSARKLTAGHTWNLGKKSSYMCTFAIHTYVLYYMLYDSRYMETRIEKQTETMNGN